MLTILKTTRKLSDTNPLLLVYDMYMYAYDSYVHFKSTNMLCLSLICNLAEIIDKSTVLNGYCPIFA